MPQVRTACVGLSTGGFVTPEPGGQYFRSQILDFGAACRIAYKVPGARFKVPAIPNPKSQIPNPKSQIPNRYAALLSAMRVGYLPVQQAVQDSVSSRPTALSIPSSER